MKMSIAWTMEPNTVITQEAADNLVGQWVTVLAFGNSRMARVESAERQQDGAAVLLTLEVGEPEEAPEPEPVFLSGDQEVTQDLGTSSSGNA